VTNKHGRLVATLTAEEFNDRLRDAPPPTDDDVGITWDGRRIDTVEKLVAFAAEIEQHRRDEAAMSDSELAEHRAARETERLAGGWDLR
jgi:hypothetical protein